MRSPYPGASNDESDAFGVRNESHVARVRAMPCPRTGIRPRVRCALVNGAKTRQTPLYDVHRSLGATMIDFAGWAMPLRYRSETAEHNAVRAAAGLFDLTHMGQIEVVGTQAGQALDYALVGDISAMALNKAKYTMLSQDDGGVLDDLVVYRLSERRYLVVANAANTAMVMAELQERAKGFDASIICRREGWALLAVQGPNAEAIVADVAGSDIRSLPYYAAQAAKVRGHGILLARTGYTGEDGFEVFCHAADATRIWELLIDQGAAWGLVPAGLACRDTLRLEAGMPLYGHELTVAVTPYEAGLGWVVKPDGLGEFIGGEALSARARGSTTRQLVGLTLTGRRIARAGYVVRNPQTGAQVGEVTSGAPSPTLGHPIAMAYLESRWAIPGTVVEVDVRGVCEPAQVVRLPFYRRNR